MQHSDPCALSALEPFFCDFSAARPRFVARLARSDSPQSRGPCPRADPPSPRPSRSASEVARSRLRDLPRSRLRGLLHFSAFSLTFHSPPITAVVSGTNTIGHSLHIADRVQGLTGTLLHDVIWWVNSWISVELQLCCCCRNKSRVRASH